MDVIYFGGENRVSAKASSAHSLRKILRAFLRFIHCAEPCELLPLQKRRFKSQSQHKKESPNGLSFLWRREQDSNLRYLAAHTLSKRAPSTTRTPLLVETHYAWSIYFVNLPCYVVSPLNLTNSKLGLLNWVAASCSAWLQLVILPELYKRHDTYGCIVLKTTSIMVWMEIDQTVPVIELHGLTKRYGVGDAEHTVIDALDLTIEKGEFIAIMGPSGCGKTTLLNILGLLDRGDDGDYLLDGISVDTLSSARRAHIRSNQVGFVFQNFNLVPRLNVIDNVALPLTYKGLRRTKRLKQASKMLGTFHLSEREYYMPWQLSGGQTQRVAIARALVNDPSIVLADEPTGNLDSRSSHVIMEELADIHARGNTIIMVTHNPDLTSYASRVIHMIDGRIDSDTKAPRAKKTTAPKKRLDTNVTKPAKKSPKKRVSKKASKK